MSSTSRPFPKARADGLAEELDLSLDVPICYACLGMVAVALEYSDEAEIRSQIWWVTGTLWDEGLKEIAFASVREACERGIRDGEAGLADLELRAFRSPLARAIVRRLAAELSQRTRKEMQIRDVARPRLRLAPPELN